MKIRIFPVAAIISPFWWLLANLVVSRYEGWGQWATAPLLLMPLLYSSLVGLIGMTRCVRLRAAREPLRQPVLYTLVALLPWLLLMLHRL